MTEAPDATLAPTQEPTKEIGYSETPAVTATPTLTEQNPPEGTVIPTATVVPEKTNEGSPSKLFMILGICLVIGVGIIVFVIERSK